MPGTRAKCVLSEPATVTAEDGGSRAAEESWAAVPAPGSGPDRAGCIGDSGVQKGGLWGDLAGQR